MSFSSYSSSVFGWSEMLVDGKYGKKSWREKICFPLFGLQKKKKIGLGCFPPGPIKTNFHESGENEEENGTSKQKDLFTLPIIY